MAIVKSLKSELKGRIARFEQISKYHAERRMEEMRKGRIGLEAKIASCENFLSSHHVIKIIEQKKDLMDSLKDDHLNDTTVNSANMSALKGQVVKYVI